MKKILFILLSLAILAACNDEQQNIREITVVVDNVECGKGRLYTDSGCTLITNDDKKYEYGTPLLQLTEGMSVVIKVKGFNKIVSLRYADEK